MSDTIAEITGSASPSPTPLTARQNSSTLALGDSAWADPQRGEVYMMMMRFV